MGKKYIIELEDKPFNKGNGDFLYRVKGFNSLVFDMTGIGKLTPYTEPDMEQVRKEGYEEGYENGFVAGHLKAEKSGQSFYEDGYKRGLADAWEAARKIWQSDIYLRVFKVPMRMDCFTKFSASECIEKIRQYEQEQDAEIKVGDEVCPREAEYDDMIVTRLWKDDYDSDCIDAIGFDGRIGSFLVSRVSKTGKHYEIAEVLQKMKESDNGQHINSHHDQSAG